MNDNEIKLNFSKGKGLLPAIVQDHESGKVLMLAYINEASWRKTLETGEAHYWSLDLDGSELENAAWSYPEPFPEFERLRDHFSFYPALVECRVGSNRALPQPGGFYGGWVTPELVGPFKGAPGTEDW